MSDHVCIIIPTNKERSAVQPLVDEISCNTSEPHRVIPTCQPISCSCNRNYGLRQADSELFVMMDDDVTGFHPGWLTALIEPLEADPDILVSSARLLGVDGKPNRQQGMWVSLTGKWPEVTGGKVAGACFASRMRFGLPFEERFKGGGFEDTCWLLCLKRKFPNGRIVVSNDCRLVHLHVASRQGGEIFDYNKRLYMSIHPEDTKMIEMPDWTKPRPPSGICRHLLWRVMHFLR